jgi:hypothetical protein
VGDTPRTGRQNPLLCTLQGYTREPQSQMRSPKSLCQIYFPVNISDKVAKWQHGPLHYLCQVLRAYWLLLCTRQLKSSFDGCKPTTYKSRCVTVKEASLYVFQNHQVICVHVWRLSLFIYLPPTCTDVCDHVREHLQGAACGPCEQQMPSTYWFVAVVCFCCVVTTYPVGILPHPSPFAASGYFALKHLHPLVNRSIQFGFGVTPPPLVLGLWWSACCLCLQSCIDLPGGVH